MVIERVMTVIVIMMTAIITAEITVIAMIVEVSVPMITAVLTVDSIVRMTAGRIATVMATVTVMEIAGRLTGMVIRVKVMINEDIIRNSLITVKY